MDAKELVITPLGTVSTYCTKTKNCPGFLVQCGEKNILLDCGNGISKELNFPKDLEDLTIIISHLHSDHYGELLSIAQTSYVFHKLGWLKNKILVYVPEEDKEKNQIDFDYLVNLEKEGYLQVIPYTKKDTLSFANLNICFNRNPHPIATYSTKIQAGEINFVYSSDTGFQGNCLEEFAYGANLLLCESTFLRGQKKTEDYHLFAYEAGIIARNANVEKLVLTHFWPSIDKSLYVEEAKEFFANTESAEEGKKIILRKN